MTKIVNLEELTGSGRVRNLSGHEKGLAARELFKLDELDKIPDPVTILIPSYVYAISSSFVQGMFTASLISLGSLEAFFEHYRFDAKGSIIRQVERGLAAKRLVAA